MSNFKLEFTLKQHTPIIHFQSNQAGATLRATELKPKLDKFLIEQFRKEGIDYRPFLINGQENALDYKVKIILNENIEKFNIAPVYKHYNKKKNREENRTLPFPTFFASIDKDWKEKSKNLKFIFCNTVNIEIITFNQDLKSHISNNIKSFFINHNFGMRQSKGFGSFTIKDDAEINQHYYIDINLNELKKLSHPKKKWQTLEKEIDKKFIDPNEISDLYKEQYFLFKVIDLFYNTLRSGININDFYFKSLMFLYAKEKLKVQWDKKLFKTTFLSKYDLAKELSDHSNPNCNDILTYKTQDKYLLRDCLGLSTIQEYSKPNKFTVRHPKDDPKDTFNNKNIEPNHTKRFQSPLLFKPIRLDENRYRIYIIPKEYPQEIFDETFTILKIENGNVTNKIDDVRFYPNFDLNDYLNFAFKIDIVSHLEKCDTDTQLFQAQILKKLYTQLNRQAKIKGNRR